MASTGIAERTGIIEPGHKGVVATTTMSHHGGPDHDDVTSSWFGGWMAGAAVIGEASEFRKQDRAAGTM
jgi:hypothetical protein